MEDEVGDREASQGRQGPWTGGLFVLEEREASGLPHDLHHDDQRRQGAGGGAEPEECGGVPQVR
jgi:hypothetical protein